ncbi:alpha/beta hydrolase-fold protein [Cesiribacter andamanensis]|uniref:Enterobactin/ferric enterobactin esterase n=1 Tax=Cesiribacter andamanensis AMV16 TaxID=1279009 RepID=M7N6J0_9BACT|nr:alpha/beta hydrolase-fold protein [Cesiribacter andamanensis]EMR04228.1 enterobactin/ferric enterobactin esterase [Cesiribacter andamanensis AMV16]
MQRIPALSVFLRLVSGCLLPLLLACSPTKQQVQLHVGEVPVTTPFGEPLFVAGSFNGWQPADSAYLLKKRPHGYFLTLPLAAETAEFKITRGSWQTVETDAAGQDIPNRRLDLSKPQTLRLAVAGWKDQLAEPASPPQPSAAVNVQILQDSFFMPQLNRYRRIWLYLPPDYDGSDIRFPVLYMHDGQNLFDASTSYAGEWGVDETLNRLQAKGQHPGVIVVGIDNGGEQRIPEYTPFVNSRYPSGEGAAYLRFIVETLKPYIDTHYRTLPEQEHTGLMGSSLGALISLYGAVQYPQVFGRIGLFSPAFWFNPEIFDLVEKRLDPAAGQRFLFLASEQESESMVPQMQQMHQLLQRWGVPQDRLWYKAHPDGAHSEWYWQREFEEAFKWLYEG